VPITERTYSIKKISSVKNPSSISVTIGSPDDSIVQVPRVIMGRKFCFNSWEQRFVHDMRNYCNFPSDEFEHDSYQWFDQTVDTEVDVRYGWKVRYGTRCSSAVTAALAPVSYGYAEGLRVLNIADNVGSTAGGWYSTNRYGFHVYKEFFNAANGDDTDIDVVLKARLYTNKGESLVGILIQDIDDETYWIIAGTAVYSGPTQYLLRRVANGSTPTQTLPTYGGENLFRLRRSAGSTTWYFDTATETYERQIFNPTWTNKSEFTWSQSNNNFRIGIVCCEDNGTGETFEADCYYLRFLAGGPAKCSRRYDRCVALGNYHHFNGFRKLPDVLVNYY